jgi:hypothetical protein
MLTYDEKVLLLKRLPSFELSYETILHKKVCGDVFMLIPAGKKAILWITYWRGQNICIVMPLNKSGHISIHDAEMYQLCFTNEIAYGTLIYGTIFSVNNMKHFTFENILYYKGNNIENYSFHQQINVFSNIFRNKEISQTIYTKKFIIVGMPVMCNNYEEALQIKSTLPYSVYGVNVYSIDSYIGILVIKNEVYKTEVSKPQVCKNEVYKNEVCKNEVCKNEVYKNEVCKNEVCKNEVCKNEVCKNEVSKPQVYKNEVSKPQVYKNEVCKNEVFFKVKASVDADIYNLYCSNTETSYGVAMIPSYKTSVMMNSLFRNIKENSNLDLLEESDNEEEFENIDDCKFVDTNKTLIMKCIYMPKFRKWQPISVTNDNVKIITYKDAQYLEKK